MAYARLFRGNIREDVTSVLLLFLMAVPVGSATAVAARDDGAAVVTALSGKATCTRPGQGGARPLKRGDAVRVAETLVTAPNSYLQLRLPDGAVINASPGSTLRIS